MATITIKNGNILKVTKSDTDEYWLPNPKMGGMSISLSDVDGETTGRNQYAVMFRDRVRGAGTSVRKIECTFPPLTGSELTLVLQAIDESFFKLQYPDPYTGSNREAYFYVGDRSTPIYSTTLNNEILWTDVAFNFIER